MTIMISGRALTTKVPNETDIAFVRNVMELNAMHIANGSPKSNQGVE